jgi:general secretion pathway protein B
VSYILDALKKSEKERARGAVPSIQTVHQPAAPVASKKSVWPYVIVMLLAVNAAGIAVWSWRSSSNTDVGIVNLSGVSTENSAGEPVQPADSASPQEALPRVAQPLATDGNAGSSAQSDTIESTVTETELPQEIKSAKGADKKPNVVFATEPLSVSEDELKNAQTSGQSLSQDVLIVPGSETVTEEQDTFENKDVVYRIAELPDSVKRELPAISFDGHVFSTEESQRSVMINGKKMREGQEVSNELLLDEITVEGAVFRYRGYRFQLGALQDWSFR